MNEKREETLEQKYMLTLNCLKDLMSALGTTAMIGRGWATPEQALEEVGSDLVRVVVDISMPIDIYNRFEDMVKFDDPLMIGMMKGVKASEREFSAKALNQIINSIFRVGFFLTMDLHPELVKLKPVIKRLREMEAMAEKMGFTKSKG